MSFWDMLCIGLLVAATAGVGASWIEGVPREVTGSALLLGLVAVVVWQRIMHDDQMKANNALAEEWLHSQSGVSRIEQHQQR